MKLLLLAAFLSTLVLGVVATGVDENLSPDEAWAKLQELKGNGNQVLQNTNEVPIRKALFMERQLNVRLHNKRFAKGKVTFKMELNKFADMTPNELKHLRNLQLPKRVSSVGLACDNGTTTPTTAKPAATTTAAGNTGSVDWRSRGAVNPIRNQGTCGSCWAFAAVAAIESAWFIKTGKLVQLSDQQLVDCSTSNGGCNGGFYGEAWMDTYGKGFMNRGSYSYTGSDDVCKFSSSKVIATVSSYVSIPKGDETALTNAILNKGPVAVAIYASSQAFSYYKSGVYYDPTGCGAKEADHAVVAVGYGTLNGLNYYIVRNSWGISWGMSGYVLMAKNKASHCQIADWAAYPVV